MTVKNAAEELARQIARVASIRVRYADLGAAGRPALTMMNVSLERAFKAVGSGDALDTVTAVLDLKGYKE